jgi:hypothetical protein
VSSNNVDAAVLLMTDIESPGLVNFYCFVVASPAVGILSLATILASERCEEEAVCADGCLFHRGGQKQETNWSCWQQLGAPPS